MPEQKLQGKIVCEYLDKFPNTNSLTLAKLIYKENTEVFNSVEAIRNVIRYYRGAIGSNIDKLIDKSYIRPKGVYNYHMIPESDETKYEPFRLPKIQNNILLLSDIHIPYHNIPAINAVFNYGIQKNVNTIIINGDFIDSHHLSRFEHDPRKRNFKEELDICREFFDSLQEAFPDVVIYVKEGNHDRRIKSFLMNKAPELFKVEEFNLDVLLNFGERSIYWIPDKRILKAADLNIIHGDEIGKGNNPVNFARTIFTKTKKCTIGGHLHQTAEHSEPTIEDDIIACWSVGCLCELHPFYLPIGHKWNHGAAHIRTQDDGTFKVFNFRIHNGKIL